MLYKVVERFVSINGEGQRAGFLSVFIRFAGCNLACQYCDTKWANEANAAYKCMTVDEIYKYILSTGIRNVTLTGGEPLIQPNIEALLLVLSKDKFLNVEIETNGSVDIQPYINIDNPPAFTIDYKLGTSGMENEMLCNNYKYLEKKDCVKFVVGSIEELYRAVDVITTYGLEKKCSVHISPVYGLIDMKDIIEFMKEQKLNDIRFQPQLHKFIWSPDLRGV